MSWTLWSRQVWHFLCTECGNIHAFGFFRGHIFNEDKWFHTFEELVFRSRRFFRLWLYAGNVSGMPRAVCVCVLNMWEGRSGDCYMTWNATFELQVLKLHHKSDKKWMTQVIWITILMNAVAYPTDTVQPLGSDRNPRRCVRLFSGYSMDGLR